MVGGGISNNIAATWSRHKIVVWFYVLLRASIASAAHVLCCGYRAAYNVSYMQLYIHSKGP